MNVIYAMIILFKLLWDCIQNARISENAGNKTQEIHMNDKILQTWNKYELGAVL